MNHEDYECLFADENSTFLIETTSHSPDDMIIRYEYEHNKNQDYSLNVMCDPFKELADEVSFISANKTQYTFINLPIYEGIQLGKSAG